MNINKTIGPITIKGEIDLKRGETAVLIGPNGVGKTVTLSLLAGLMKQKKGDPQIRTSLGCALQGAKCFPFSVEKNLEYFGKLKKCDEEKRQKQIQSFLSYFGIRSIRNQNYATLSRGNQKIVEIMQAFLGDPEWVLLDEPFAGLDPLIARKLEQFIVEKKKTQTMLLTSHQLHRLHLCDAFFFLHKGIIKQIKGKQSVVIQLKKKDDVFAKKISKLAKVQAKGTVLYCEGNIKKILGQLASDYQNLASLSLGNVEQMYDVLYGDH